jgi:hypothetical protein
MVFLELWIHNDMFKQHTLTLQNPANYGDHGD